MESMEIGEAVWVLPVVCGDGLRGQPAKEGDTEAGTGSCEVQMGCKTSYGKGRPRVAERGLGSGRMRRLPATIARACCLCACPRSGLQLNDYNRRGLLTIFRAT